MGDHEEELLGYVNYISQTSNSWLVERFCLALPSPDELTAMITD
jgi:hypothetical protein